MKRNELAEALWDAVERRTKMHHVQLGEGAEISIRQFARTGADRILEAHPQVTRDHQAVRDAEGAFEKLIDEMLASVDKIEGYREDHPGIIGEETLSMARAHLCPLFPIC